MSPEKGVRKEVVTGGGGGDKASLTKTEVVCGNEGIGVEIALTDGVETMVRGRGCTRWKSRGIEARSSFLSLLGFRRWVEVSSKRGEKETL